MFGPISKAPRMDRALEVRQDKRTHPLDATTAITFSTALEREKRKQQYQPSRQRRRAAKPYVPSHSGQNSDQQMQPHIDIKV